MLHQSLLALAVSLVFTCSALPLQQASDKMMIAPAGAAQMKGGVNMRSNSAIALCPGNMGTMPRVMETVAKKCAEEMEVKSMDDEKTACAIYRACFEGMTGDVGEGTMMACADVEDCMTEGSSMVKRGGGGGGAIACADGDACMTEGSGMVKREGGPGEMACADGEDCMMEGGMMKGGMGKRGDGPGEMMACADGEDCTMETESENKIPHRLLHCAMDGNGIQGKNQRRGLTC